MRLFNQKACWSGFAMVAACLVLCSCQANNANMNTNGGMNVAELSDSCQGDESAFLNFISQNNSCQSDSDCQLASSYGWACGGIGVNLSTDLAAADSLMKKWETDGCPSMMCTLEFSNPACQNNACVTPMHN